MRYKERTNTKRYTITPKVIDYLSNNSFATVPELARATGFLKTQVRQVIGKLKFDGVIEVHENGEGPPRKRTKHTSYRLTE